MNFTATELVTLLAALGGLVAGIGAVIVNVIVASRTSAKVDGIATTTKVIEGHVNSSATAAAALIASSERERLELRRQLADQKETAALLAQTAARLKPDVNQSF